jgi:DNA recombination protein RmuC
MDLAVLILLLIVILLLIIILLKNFFNSQNKNLEQIKDNIEKKLEEVYKGIGEIHSLAYDIRDLKKALNNIKTRGLWGEIQLGSLLDQILSPEQYEKNVITKEGSKERVEYAIKLPGRNENKVVYLPIDAKFPLESYYKLLDACDKGDKELIKKFKSDLEIIIKNAAKDIQQKYIDPPNTTDFGIMFLPSESLYVEVLKIPGLIEEIQSNNRIIIAGPTTLAGLLNSLQMIFLAIAVEKRSSEILALFNEIKTQFNHFVNLLEKASKKLQEVSSDIEDAIKRSEKIEQKIENIQITPYTTSQNISENPMDENK